MTRFQFDIQATDGSARTGVITMQRGEIRTPAFMPVGTAATVKAMKPEHVRTTGMKAGVIGDLLAAPSVRDGVTRNKAFIATKVWTRGRESGIEQMERVAAPAAGPGTSS